MRDFRSIRGFGAGVLVGVLIGSAGVSVAAIGYKGWQRFSVDFRRGYVAGFVDMSNLARNLDPGGYIDQNYPYVVGSRPNEWADMLDELYKDPKNQHYTITSLLMLAAHNMEKRYGSAGTPEARVTAKMQMQLEAVKRQREKMGLPPSEGKTKAVEAPPKVVTAPKPQSDKPPKEPFARKWCRCDGKDPKQARADRNAAQAEKNKGEDAKPASKDAASTPPAAEKAAPAEKPESKDAKK